MNNTEPANTVTVNPYVTMGMQFGLTVLALVFLGAGWWVGKIPSETSLPICIGLISLWISNPVIAAKIPIPLVPGGKPPQVVATVVKENDNVR